MTRLDIGLSQLLSKNGMSPDDYAAVRERIWLRLRQSAEWEGLDARQQRRVYELIWEPSKPLAGVSAKELGAAFHPALKTPFYAAHRVLSAAEPTGLYRSAAEGGIAQKGMTPQQLEVEHAMWERLAPQNKIAKAAVDIGGTLAGVAVPATAISKLSQAAKLQYAPGIMKLAKAGLALKPLEAARLAAIDASAWGGGFGLMEGVRALTDLKSPEEAARVAIKSGVTTGVFVGGASALGQVLRTIRSVPDLNKTVRGLADGSLDPDDVLRMATEKLSKAKNQKIRDAWTTVQQAASKAREHKVSTQAARMMGVEGYTLPGEAAPWRGAPAAPGIGGPVPGYTLIEPATGAKTPIPAASRPITVPAQHVVVRGQAAQLFERPETKQELIKAIRAGKPIAPESWQKFPSVAKFYNVKSTPATPIKRPNPVDVLDDVITDTFTALDDAGTPATQQAAQYLKQLQNDGLSYHYSTYDKAWAAMQEVHQTTLIQLRDQIDDLVRAAAKPEEITAARNTLANFQNTMDFIRARAAVALKGKKQPLDALPRLLPQGKQVAALTEEQEVLRIAKAVEAELRGVGHKAAAEFHDATLGAMQRNHLKAVADFVNMGGEKGYVSRRVMQSVMNGHRVNNMQRILEDALATRWAKELKGVDEHRKLGMINVIEAIGKVADDDPKIAREARWILDNIRPKLTPGQLRLVEEQAKIYDAWFKLAKAEGALDDNAYVQGYFARLLKRPKGMSKSKFANAKATVLNEWYSRSGGVQKGEAIPTAVGGRGFQMRRKFIWFDEFKNFANERGLEVVTDPVEAMSAYTRSVAEVVGWQRAVAGPGGIMGITAADGTPLVAVGHRPGWEKLLHNAFDQVVARSMSQKSRGVVMRQTPVYAHPSVAKVVNSLFAPPQATSAPMHAYMQLANLVKRFTFLNPAIHGKNLFSDFLDETHVNMFRQFSKGRAAWHDLVKGNIDDLAKQIYGDKSNLMLKAVDAGLETTGRWTLADWMGMEPDAAHGPAGIWRWMFGDKNPILRANDQAMFRWGLRYSQLGTYEMKVRTLMAKYPKAEIKSVERAAAHFVNDLFGTLPKHWFQNYQYIWGGRLLLARNWTLSNLDLVAKAASKRGLGSASLSQNEMAMIQMEYIKHLVKGVLALGVQVEVLTYGASKMLSDDGKAHHIWEYPADEWLEIHTGKADSKGREIKFGVPLFAYIRDILSWSPVPTPLHKDAIPFAKTLYNKAHPVWKVPIEAGINYSVWQGRNISSPGAPPAAEAAERLKYLAEGYAPPVRPLTHMITGSPQPGVTEPRYIPILAFVLGGHTSHGRAGALSAPDLYEKMEKYQRELVYKRSRLDDKLDEHLAKGEFAEARMLALQEKRYADPRSFVQRQWRHACPMTARLQSMSRRDRYAFMQSLTAEERKRLNEALAQEKTRAQAVFLTDYRKKIGEWVPGE